jgi:translocation and assembly module TamA
MTTAGASRRPAPAAFVGRLLAMLAAAAMLAATPLARGATTVTGTRPVVIQAPGSLETLLVANLDLARAARLTGEAALDDGEWARLIAAAPAQARELVATEGYFQAVATVTVQADAAHTIRVDLAPGEQAMVDRVTLQFDGDLDRAVTAGDARARNAESLLRRSWAMPEGSRFRNPAWGDAKSQFLAKLRGQGYGAAAWSGTAATVDPATNRVQLFLVADSGPLFRAGDLVVEGTVRQPEATIRHLAGFMPGAPLDETLLDDFQDRLQKTGLYDQIAVTYDTDPAQAAHATVTVRVHEQSLQQLTTAVGVTTGTGSNSSLDPRISVEYVNRLPFGHPISADNKLVLGKLEQTYQLDLVTQPGENFHSWLTGLLLDRTIVEDVDTTTTERVRFGRTRNTTRFDRLQFVQAERSVQCVEGAPYCTDARAFSLNQNTVWRRVDSIILPTEGWTLATQVGGGIAGGPIDGGAETRYGPFARLWGRYTEYWALPSHFYATGRLELGQVLVTKYADPLTGALVKVNVPEPELFRAGGDESVRGYPYETLAPMGDFGTVVGGHSVLTMSMEVAHPISEKLPSVWGAAFVDVGNAFERFSDASLHTGPGVGVRWRSPVGPLRIDVAYGVAIKAWQLSLGIGIAF